MHADARFYRLPGPQAYDARLDRSADLLLQGASGNVQTDFCGLGAANGVFNAIGIRIRSFPTTLGNLSPLSLV